MSIDIKLERPIIRRDFINMKLKDFIPEGQDNIIAGLITSRYVPDDFDGISNNDNITNIRILKPSAITLGKIDINNIENSLAWRKIPNEYIVKRGDVILKLSSPYDSAVITEESEGMVLPHFCCRFTNLDEIDPWFLVAYLSSSYCQKQIERKCSGAIVSMLKISSIRELEIPNLSKSEQQRITERFKNGLKMKELGERAFRLNSELNDNEFFKKEDL